MHEKHAPCSIAWRLETRAGCPVRVPCLKYALGAEFGVIGVWGGSTTLERK
jgi:hypothetical protein